MGSLLFRRVLRSVLAGAVYFPPPLITRKLFQWVCRGALSEVAAASSTQDQHVTRRAWYNCEVPRKSFSSEWDNEKDVYEG